MSQDSCISKKEWSYLNTAKQYSLMSNHRHKIGCSVVMGHKIISCGHNSNTKTAPIQAMLDKECFKCDCAGKVHAETDALLYFIRNNIQLKGATLYTYREKKDGSFGCARPCSRCMQLIKLVGIRKLVYTTDDGVAKEKLL